MKCFEFSILYSSCVCLAWTILKRTCTNLALCVNDLSKIWLAFVYNLFAECALDSRVVNLDEMSFDISDSQGRFACARSASPAQGAVSFVPTLLEPRTAIFLCLTVGAISVEIRFTARLLLGLLRGQCIALGVRYKRKCANGCYNRSQNMAA